MLRHHIYVAWLSLVAFGMSGCSILDVKIESQTTPFTKQELNIRLFTREYTQHFFSHVEKTADTVSLTYSPEDKLHQSYLLLWKINAEEGIQRATYQVSPMAGLIDTWVFTAQMDKFFNHGAGQSLFTGSEVSQTASQLRSDAEKLAESQLNSETFASTKAFVERFATDNPFHDLTFIRTPAYRAWLKSQSINEAEAVSTLGTMPEAIGDVSDRLSLVSEQAPKLMTWKAELIAMNSSISGEQLTETLRSLRTTSEAFQDFVKNNPEYMENLTSQMATQLQPLVNDIDIKTEARLDQLGEERKALEAMVARERAEFALILSSERQNFSQDLDRISQEVVSLAMSKLITLIKSTIFYFILFIVAIFFAPFGLGYMLGKRSAAK